MISCTDYYCHLLSSFHPEGLGWDSGRLARTNGRRSTAKQRYMRAQ